jgi:hypothetical protein
MVEPDVVSGEDRPVKDGRGHFFAIDRRCWSAACGLGLNPAVAYLVLTRFTGRDQRTTIAGTNAVEERTGVSRLRAKKAIASLVERGLVSAPIKGTQRRFAAAHELPECTRPAPTDQERAVIDRVAAGMAPARADRWLARSAADKRWLRHLGNNRYEVVPAANPAPDWIWLPNSLVDGAAAETPPLELLRQAGESQILRLFIDLYHAQSLALDGGVHFRKIRVSYKRALAGRSGPFDVWAFVADQLTAWKVEPFSTPAIPGDKWAADLWPRWETISGLGLVEIVPHLIEGDTDYSEIIHPYGMEGRGEPDEIDLGQAAHEAGRRMVSEAQYQRVAQELGSLPWLAPVPRHIVNVQMVGIARLRYRARTAATAAWYGRMEEWRESAMRFRSLASTNAAPRSQAAQAVY